MQEFQNRSEVRIGANPKLIPAFMWEIWENELGNGKYYLEYLFIAVLLKMYCIFLLSKEIVYILIKIYIFAMYKIL